MNDGFKHRRKFSDSSHGAPTEKRMAFYFQALQLRDPVVGYMFNHAPSDDDLWEIQRNLQKSSSISTNWIWNPRGQIASQAT